MGNPMNPLIWTSKSVRKITAEVVASRGKGHYSASGLIS